MKRPLLSVGIPAYNRPEALERAVRSALDQDLADLEVVVSDDASPDLAVERVGRQLAQADPRVRFFRQPHNLGHVRNYRWVLDAAHGSLFMWLSDDDFLDRAYARRCVQELEAAPGRRLVCGRARYYAAGELVSLERSIDLASRRPGARVLGFYSRVNMNGPLFGVMQRRDLLGLPFPDVPGGDWLLVGRMAARGELRTLGDVHIHRSMGGLGADEQRLARSFGLSGVFARWHHVGVAARVWRDIAATLPAPPIARHATAALCALVLLGRYPLVQLLRAAGLGPLERRAVAWARGRRQ